MIHYFLLRIVRYLYEATKINDDINIIFVDRLLEVARERISRLYLNVYVIAQSTRLHLSKIAQAKRVRNDHIFLLRIT